MKINNKHYFTMNKVIETNDLDIISEYINDIKSISKENQDKLVDLAIASKDPDFIIKVACVIQRMEKVLTENIEDLEKLAATIIEMNILDYIFNFSRFIYKINIETKNKLVDAFIKSNSKYYHAFMHPQSCDIKGEDYKNAQEESYKMTIYPKSKYICNFVQYVKWLNDDHIDKLADYIISAKDIKYICEFLKYANISSKKMLELEKYMLKNYQKDLLAKILKSLNNVQLINMIYGSESILDNFLIDLEKYNNDNFKYASNQMQNYTIGRKGKCHGGVYSSSGFIQNEQLRIAGYRKKTTDELFGKYKFVDDNIKNVLNSERYKEVIDNTNEVQEEHLQNENVACLKYILKKI